MAITHKKPFRKQSQPCNSIFIIQLRFDFDTTAGEATMMSFAPLSLLVHLAACHNVCRPLSRVKLFALRRILSNTDAAASVATNWLAPRFGKIR